jgi:uncharacterized protein
MPVSGAISLPDANVWLALVFSDHAHHKKAVAWFDSQLNGTCSFCRVTQMALLRHVTNSKIMGQFVQTQRDAWGKYQELAKDPRVTFLPELGTIEAIFRNFTQAVYPSHGIWTDAYLAAFAITHQAQLVTFDHGFGRFDGLKLLDLTTY